MDGQKLLSSSYLICWPSCTLPSSSRQSERSLSTLYASPGRHGEKGGAAGAGAGAVAL